MDRKQVLRELEPFRAVGGWYLPATDKWIGRVNGVFYVIDDRKHAVTHRQIVEMVRIECRVQREVGF